MTLYQDCSSRHDSSKNMAVRGRGIFFLYIYIENFKNLLVRNCWIEFNVTWQECCFGDLLPRLRPHDTSKNMAVRGRGLFSVYICIENFKILLVRKHLTDFNITWQECCFGDPLSRLFKQHDSSKNMVTRFGAYFPYISVRSHWTDFNITWQDFSFGDPLPSLFKLSWFVKKHGR